MIEVTNLRKLFGDFVAVQDVSFTVEQGELFGLLGPNGAGKSTTISCISGLLKPSEGTVRVLGCDVVHEPKDAKQRLGVVPQELALYEGLSAVDNLSYWGAAYGLGGAELKSRVAHVLERIGLADRAQEPAKNFSGGMKRRLNFGCGVVHQPKVLLLDEPTVGVDPQSRVKLLDLVQEELARGTSVLYTTHYMEEAQSLCDRVAIMDHGVVIAMGSLDELREMLGERDLVQLLGAFDPTAVRDALDGTADVEIVSVDAERLILATEGASRKLPAIFGALSSAGSDVRETTLKQPSLETLFIKLTGRELRK